MKPTSTLMKRKLLLAGVGLILLLLSEYLPAQELVSSRFELPEKEVQTGKGRQSLQQLLSELEIHYKVSFIYQVELIQNKEIEKGAIINRWKMPSIIC